MGGSLREDWDLYQRKQLVIGNIRDRESNIHILGRTVVRAKWDVKKRPVNYKIT